MALLHRSVIVASALCSLTSPSFASSPSSVPGSPTDGDNAAPAAPVQTRHGTVDGHGAWLFHEVVPDLQRTHIGIGVKAKGAALDRFASSTTLIAINGAYFDHDFAPVNWLRDKGVDLHQPNRLANRAGVLSLRPAGKRSVAGVAPLIPWIGALKWAPSDPVLAVQNSPLLVTDGRSIVGNFGNGRRASRTAACLSGTAKKSGKESRAMPPTLKFVLILAAPGFGPTLGEFADLLVNTSSAGGFDCDAALNLDGGPSSGIWYRDARYGPSALPLAPIGHAILIHAR